METTQSRVCRLCTAVVPSVKAISLFTVTGLGRQWPQRIQCLLDVDVSAGDGMSRYICGPCRTRIQQLERAVIDLEAFKELAKRSAMSNSAASAKRSKSTSGDIGVSPDTMRLRPRSKIPRKRLDFQCKCIYNQYI